MIEAMSSADVGDDVFKEDPTVNKLEERLCDMFGMESALFFPSGTMANQTAIKIHTNPGDQLICDKYAHVFNYEGGGVSFNSGVSCKLIDGIRGMFKNSQLLNAINPPDFYHSPKTSLVCIENTTNKGGGACWDINELKVINKTCKKNNLAIHLDGARIWNALVKNSDDKIQGMLVLTLTHGFLGLIFAYFTQVPRIEAWPWLLASVFFHVIYQCLLALAYNYGNLSRVYPIARGTAPFIVLLVSLFFLDSALVKEEIIGIIILGFGLLMMTQGVFSNHENLRLLPFALGSAIATAGYTLSDGLGARISENATSYISWLFILTVPIFIPTAIALKGISVINIPMKTWKIGLAAGLFSFFSYWVAIWAMTKAPIPLVIASLPVPYVVPTLFPEILYVVPIRLTCVAAALTFNCTLLVILCVKSALADNGAPTNPIIITNASFFIAFENRDYTGYIYK